MKTQFLGFTLLAVLMWVVPASAQSDSCDAAYVSCDDYAQDYSCSSNCGCNKCGPSGGWFGGTELALLTAHTGGLAVNIPGLNTGDFQVTPEYDLDVAPRFWVGYEAPGGLAIRARGWIFDDSASGTDLQDAPLPDIDLPVIDLPGNIPFDLSTRLKAHAIDVEIAECQKLCNWDFEFAAGVRQAKIEESYLLSAPGMPIELFRDFEGAGPTVALNASRPIGCNGLSLVGGFRASLLYGDSNLGLAGILGGASLTADQHMMEIYELRFGGRWTRDYGSNRLFAQVVYEAQAWELPPIALGILDSNIGFVGPSFSIGILR